MAFLTYRFFTEEEPAVTPRTAPIATDAPYVRTDIATETTPPETETTVPETTAPEMTKAVTTPPLTSAVSVGYSDAAEVATPGWETVGYDRDFFADDFFIGDSLSAGLLDFGVLPPANLFTKVGLNPINIKTAEMNGTTAYAKARALQPKRIFIMLGTNGMDYLSGGVMTAKMGEIILDLKEICPDSEVILLTIPPVTLQYETTNDKDINMEKINSYNSQLKTLAEENGYTLIDTAEILKDDDGYLSSSYAERDGMHLLITAYKALLSFIQDSLDVSDVSDIWELSETAEDSAF